MAEPCNFFAMIDKATDNEVESTATIRVRTAKAAKIIQNRNVGWNGSVSVASSLHVEGAGEINRILSSTCVEASAITAVGRSFCATLFTKVLVVC